MHLATTASYLHGMLFPQDIARHTPDTHPDKAALTTAVALYTAIAEKCTKVKKLREQERRLMNNEVCCCRR